jgi:hypothetical protein
VRRSIARDVLRASWPGTRVLKTALASGLAWWVAASWLGDAAPMFAVFGAFNAVQPTVAGSLRNTGGALLGIVLGTALAVLSESVVGAPRALMVAVLVALGLLTALRLHAYALLGTEVAVTGLLVFALSQGSVLWAAGRFGETALGGGIAVLVNALVLPPDYRQDTRRAIDVLADKLARHARTALADAVQLPPPALTEAHLLATTADSRLAEELVVQAARAQESLRFSPVLRYSPWRRGSRADIERYAAGVTVLESGLAHARTAARAAWHASRRSDNPGPPAATGVWDRLMADTQVAIVHAGQSMLDGSSTASEAAEHDLRAALASHAAVVSAVRLAAGPWDMDRATVLAETEHVLDELLAALG